VKITIEIAGKAYYLFNLLLPIMHHYVIFDFWQNFGNFCPEVIFLFSKI